MIIYTMFYIISGQPNSLPYLPQICPLIRFSPLSSPLPPPTHLCKTYLQLFHPFHYWSCCQSHVAHACCHLLYLLAEPRCCVTIVMSQPTAISQPWQSPYKSLLPTLLLFLSSLPFSSFMLGPSQSLSCHYIWVRELWPASGFNMVQVRLAMA